MYRHASQRLYRCKIYNRLLKKLDRPLNIKNHKGHCAINGVIIILLLCMTARRVVPAAQILVGYTQRWRGHLRCIKVNLVHDAVVGVRRVLFEAREEFDNPLILLPSGRDVVLRDNWARPRDPIRKRKLDLNNS